MLSLSDLCLDEEKVLTPQHRRREEDFKKKNINFTLFTPPPPPLRAMKFIIFCLLTLETYTPKLVKIGPVVVEKRCKRTTDDDGCQPIAKGHLIDSVT